MLMNENTAGSKCGRNGTNPRGDKHNPWGELRDGIGGVRPVTSCAGPVHSYYTMYTVHLAMARGHLGVTSLMVVAVPSAGICRGTRSV